MNILNWLKEKWEAYRLNHHDCNKHLIYVDHFRTRCGNEYGYIESVTAVYKCGICGKRVDIN